MGITERREREREEVRRKILDAARDLFATEGYPAVTMRKIAEAIEYSPTAIYGHFEDKDDLVLALCHEDFARLLAVFDGQAANADPIERIRQLGRGYALFAEQNPNHYRFMFMTPGKIEHPHALSEPGQQSFQRLLAAVEEGIAQGRFCTTNALLISQVLWASLHGAVALLVTYKPEHFPCAPPAADLVQQTCDNALRGFLIEPGGAAPRPPAPPRVAPE
jgi:AcrR family transcriptional regulator